MRTQRHKIKRHATCYSVIVLDCQVHTCRQDSSRAVWCFEQDLICLQALDTWAQHIRTSSARISITCERDVYLVLTCVLKYRRVAHRARASNLCILHT